MGSGGGPYVRQGRRYGHGQGRQRKALFFEQHLQFDPSSAMYTLMGNLF